MKNGRKLSQVLWGGGGIQKGQIKLKAEKGMRGNGQGKEKRRKGRAGGGGGGGGTTEAPTIMTDGQ